MLVGPQEHLRSSGEMPLTLRWRASCRGAVLDSLSCPQPSKELTDWGMDPALMDYIRDGEWFLTWADSMLTLGWIGVSTCKWAQHISSTARQPSICVCQCVFVYVCVCVSVCVFAIACEFLILLCACVNGRELICICVCVCKCLCVSVCVGPVCDNWLILPPNHHSDITVQWAGQANNLGHRSL